MSDVPKNVKNLIKIGKETWDYLHWNMFPTFIILANSSHQCEMKVARSGGDIYYKKLKILSSYK